MKRKWALGLWTIALSYVLTSCSAAVSQDKSPGPIQTVETTANIPTSTPNPIPTSTLTPTPLLPAKAYMICIDPGHQAKANNELEPVGPHSKEMKPKVSSGTQGITTKKPESVLNLEVSLLLRDKLLAEGYQVMMTREKQDVNLSNKDRADIANNAQADLFVRIHADGSELQSIEGISVQYPAENSSFPKTMLQTSKDAAAEVLKVMLDKTGAKSKGIVARSDLSGFNWAKVPSILIEMGFMTNSAEDVRMSTADYQDKLADGIKRGIEQWITKYSK
jgi:N-acetylmuramoyl-L-alanine amidase